MQRSNVETHLGGFQVGISDWGYPVWIPPSQGLELPPGWQQTSPRRWSCSPGQSRLWEQRAAPAGAAPAAHAPRGPCRAKTRGHSWASRENTPGIDGILPWEGLDSAQSPRDAPALLKARLDSAWSYPCPWLVLQPTQTLPRLYGSYKANLYILWIIQS